MQTSRGCQATDELFSNPLWDGSLYSRDGLRSPRPEQILRLSYNDWRHSNDMPHPQPGPAPHS